MGKTCEPKAFSFQCMTKFTTNKNLKKREKKKKRIQLSRQEMQETRVPSLGWEDPPGEGKGYPLQYSGLENSMECTVYGVAKIWTQLTDFHYCYSLNVNYLAPDVKQISSSACYNGPFHKRMQTLT